ncbi:hypothetical protein [Fibrisoma limi]|nr:hypothetical protein [Fibrisoma limi]
MANYTKPPGRRLIKRMSTRTKWLILAPVSLALIGAGLCVFSEAGQAKHTGQPFRQWFLWGTYGLILINGGLALFGQAVRYRVQLDYRRFVRRQLKKQERQFVSKKRKTPPTKGGV